ncbi:PAS domain S-box protein [Haloparvum sedimenti]|uniref:PAS domain S-box protein n=1 Tax=Haloparvum sedimenti TaxID=1678448 RepID=UPI00071E7094|nr:PAS domain S-box protein [Haloparvum sedimenti]
MTGDAEASPDSAVPAELEDVDILHVDDEPDFADLVATFLEREHGAFTVHTETDPRDALDRLDDEDCTVDCVVSDYDMPGLDGLNFLERVRDRRPGLPFVLFTGKGSEEIASEAISAGVTDYLQKAGGTEQYRVLANRVRNAVAGYRAERDANRGLEAIETARDGIAILDGDGHIEYANDACGEILGYDREELVGLHWETFYRDEDVPFVYDVLLPEAREGRWRGTTSFLQKDGTEIDVDHALSYSDDGSLICTLSPRAIADTGTPPAMADTGATPPSADTGATPPSARERAMNEAPIGIVLTDPLETGEPIVYANDAFTMLTGYETHAVVGRDRGILWGEDTAAGALAELRTAIDDREPATVELRSYRKDGEEFWNRVRVAPLFDDEGDLDFFVEFHEDVTERKRDEERLQSHTARLEALFEHSPDMIAVHDIDGVIRDVNQRLCAELGYAESELVGRTVWDIDPTADRDRATSFWETLPPNTSHRFEGKLEREDGSTFPIEVHLIRLNLDGEDRFVAMDRDISRQKRRERELVQQNERLDRFTSVVSHDLRNPLQVAEGRIELLREDCESEHIDGIDDALDRMDALIEDLLALAQTGEAAMDIEPVRLSDIVRTCWETLPTANATLTVETDRTVEADRDQLRQLVSNLLRNAVKHGGADVSITAGDTADGFYVSDDGVGLPESELEDVFESGYTTAADGTGFGLSIVDEVADRHGWAVSATNGDDGGARFDVTTDR